MTLQTLRVQKAEHLYLFRYTPGHEDEIVEEVMRLADDPEAEFDWMDAASVSHRVTQQVGDAGHSSGAFLPEV